MSDEPRRRGTVAAGVAGDGKETVRVDRRLPVFRSDDDGGRIEQTFVLERIDHLSDRRVDELNLSEHFWSGRTLCILIAARVCVGSVSGFGLNQLLSNTDRLEVHAEDYWNRSLVCAEVCPAVDLVECGVDLQLVVAPDGIEVGGPVIAIGNQRTAVKTGLAGEGRRLDSGQLNLKGVDFRRIIIIHVAGLIGSRGTGN